MAFIGPENYEKNIELIKRIRKNAGNRVNIMLDAVGPRVKLGKLPPEGINLVEGKNIVITSRMDQKVDDTIVTTIFHQLPVFAKVGEPVLLAEGKFQLKITKIINNTDIECLVTKGGLLKKVIYIYTR